MYAFVLVNDRERYDKVIDEASRLITPSQLALLKLGLSMHIYSPKVQMYGQIAQERNLPSCPAVADVGGTLICDIGELKKLIKNVSSYRIFFHNKQIFSYIT